MQVSLVVCPSNYFLISTSGCSCCSSHVVYKNYQWEAAGWGKWTPLPRLGDCREAWKPQKGDGSPAPMHVGHKALTCQPPNLCPSSLPFCDMGFSFPSISVRQSHSAMGPQWALWTGWQEGHTNHLQVFEWGPINGLLKKQRNVPIYPFNPW